MNEVKLMTKIEMIERLNNGEDAFDLCIEKWERIKTELEIDGTVQDYQILSDSCALCDIHSSCCCGSNEKGILPCPLYQIYQACGNDYGNAWEQFEEESSVENAQNMINTIKRSRGDCLS